jgi:hypothetical protein
MYGRRYSLQAGTSKREMQTWQANGKILRFPVQFPRKYMTLRYSSTEIHNFQVGPGGIKIKELEDKEKEK